METFQAAVQYGDWKGSAAADNADQFDLPDFVREKFGLSGSEFVAGITVWVGENHGGKVERPHVRALIATRESLKSEPLTFREENIEVSIEEFLGFFKRFSVELELRDAGIHGREYQTDKQN